MANSRMLSGLRICTDSGSSWRICKASDASLLCFSMGLGQSDNPTEIISRKHLTHLLFLWGSHKHCPCWCCLATTSFKVRAYTESATRCSFEGILAVLFRRLIVQFALVWKRTMSGRIQHILHAFSFTLWKTNRVCFNTKGPAMASKSMDFLPQHSLFRIGPLGKPHANQPGHPFFVQPLTSSQCFFSVKILPLGF